MKNIVLFLLCILIGQFSRASMITVGTHAVKEGCSVLIPVTLAAEAGVSSVSVQISYDPQVLTVWRVDAGDLGDTFDDDFITSIDRVNGQIRIAAFASKNCAVAVNGRLATLVFSAGRNRAGTQTDVAVTRASLGEETGVVDVTYTDPLDITNGVVKILEMLGNEVRISVDANTIPLFVSDTYVSDVLNLSGIAATPEAIRAALETPAANGMKTWQTYVLNLSRTEATARVLLRSCQTKDSRTITLTAPVVPLVDMGVKVTFLLQRSLDSGKSWTDYGSAQAIPTFAVDVANDPTGIYRVKTLFTAAE